MLSDTWQAIEDFNGHLYLAILNENQECIWLKSNYERTPGKLVKHIYFCVETKLIPAQDSDEEPDVKYQKLISRDQTGQWLIADQHEIYWENMHKVAEKEFKNNKIKWEY